MSNFEKPELYLVQVKINQKAMILGIFSLNFITNQLTIRPADRLLVFGENLNGGVNYCISDCYIKPRKSCFLADYIFWLGKNKFIEIGPVNFLRKEFVVD